MTLRLSFVAAALEDVFSVTELASQYGVSRKTAYKWIHRFLEEGVDGLVDHPSIARFVANRTPAHIEDVLVELRTKRGWGPKKLLKVLGKRRPDLRLPSRSTVAEILKRRGLVRTRQKRQRQPHPGRPDSQPLAANQIWGVDFKGQFRTRDGIYCYPFTVSDLYSRFLICCDGYLSTSYEGVRRSLEIAFRQYGLPEAIRSDNGSPFASTGIARLSRLGVWLLRLGVRRELIQPGRPTQNGRHERMHKTLKSEAIRPPEANLPGQQRRFDDFRHDFNHERPHEALGQITPAELYHPSPRPFPEKLPEPVYPPHFEVRRVSRNGGIRWKSHWLNVGHSLIEQHLGFEQVDDGTWDAYFSTLRLGRFNERDLRLIGTIATHPRCGKRGNLPSARY